MIIFDASTLILLAKIELLRTISQMREIWITREVEQEATYHPEFFDAKVIIQLIREHKIQVGKVKNQRLIKKIEIDFGLVGGEASSLVMTKEKQGVLATDDGRTIKACKILGIKFVTAIHFLIDVYYKKKINKKIAIAKLERLKDLGRYNPKIISDALSRIERGQ